MGSTLWIDNYLKNYIPSLIDHKLKYILLKIVNMILLQYKMHSITSLEWVIYILKVFTVFFVLRRQK